MTSTIFETWLRKLDRKFLLQGRSIAMIKDNCPVHPNIDGLRSIKLVFLPPNTTGNLQPCDQEIIHSQRRHYRARVIKKYLDHIKDKMSTNLGELAISEISNMSVLDKLYDLRFAWDKVTESTIKHCFCHAGFFK